jgi:hypothetical protein
MPLSKIDFTKLIESSSLGHVMFCCGTVYSFKDKVIIKKSEHFYFACKLDISFKEMDSCDSITEMDFIKKLFFEILGDLTNVNFLLH